jgi:hypothetical protein
MLSKVRRSCAGKSPMWTLLPFSSIDAVPEMSRMRHPADIDPHAARKRTRLGIGIGFVEHAVIGHGALFDGRVRDGFQNFCKCIHVCISPYCSYVFDEFRDSNPWRGDPDVVALKVDAENIVVAGAVVTGISVTLPRASRTVISGLPSLSEGR